MPGTNPAKTTRNTARGRAPEPPRKVRPVAAVTSRDAAGYGGWNGHGDWDDGWDDDGWDDATEPVPVVPATPEQLAELNRSAARTLLRSIVVQVVVALVVAGIAWLVAGAAAGASALAGAAAYTVPSVLFALRLLFGMVKPGGANPATFFFGEFFKLGSTALLLGLAVKLGQNELVWPALLAGLIVALKSHYLLLLFEDL
jgi:ATP synthase protein I